MRDCTVVMMIKFPVPFPLLQASQAGSPVARLQAEVTRLAQHAQREREVGL